LLGKAVPRFIGCLCLRYERPDELGNSIHGTGGKADILVKEEALLSLLNASLSGQGLGGIERRGVDPHPLR